MAWILSLIERPEGKGSAYNMVLERLSEMKFSSVTKNTIKELAASF